MNAQPDASGGLTVTDLVVSYEGAEVVHGVSFSVHPSEFVTLLGPSGCGKSTTLRCIAGLHHIDSGSITINGREVAGDGVHVRPEHRNINMVFQSYAIWPHMSVFDNVAYGLKVQKLGRKVIADRTHEMLELVGLRQMSERPATGLSGGQQQRVALARALATRPSVLLLDEPLSNLDATLRTRMRGEILRIQRETGTTTLYVTHDRSEALSMSDKIVVLNTGIVSQIGAPRDLYANPADRFIAGFLGPANFIRAQVVARDALGLEVVAPELDGAPRFKLARSGGPDVENGGWIELIVRPERLQIQTSGDLRQNAFMADVVHHDFMGGRSEAALRSGAAMMSCDADSKTLARLKETRVMVSIAPEDVTWVPCSNLRP